MGNLLCLSYSAHATHSAHFIWSLMRNGYSAYGSVGASVVQAAAVKSFVCSTSPGENPSGTGTKGAAFSERNVELTRSR